jgi:hypothetical protein
MWRQTHKSFKIAATMHSDGRLDLVRRSFYEDSYRNELVGGFVYESKFNHWSSVTFFNAAPPTLCAWK